MKHPRSLAGAAALALSLASALALAPPPASAEELRSVVGGIASVTAENAEGAQLSLGFDEALAILVPKESPFIQGIEIEIRSPRAAIVAPGGFSYELWRRIEPSPDRKRLSYRGERVITQPLPARAGYAIQIPTRADHELKKDPYATILPIVAGIRDFPLLLKIVPIAKGISADAEAAKFQVRVRPLLNGQGGLSLKLRYPDVPAAPDRAVTILVDERKVDPSSTIILQAGTHRVGVSSEAYRDESRVVAIEEGRVAELVVELQDTTPVVTIEAPDAALVTLDGAKVDHVARPSLTVEPGDHVVSCKIGDYTVARKFTAARGKSYRLVLEVELSVQEEP
jgi:hypothetical protein